MSKKILIINGPNLNLLGEREPDIYGKITLKDIELLVSEQCGKYSMEVEFFQSNSESDIVDKIQQASKNFNLIIINAAAYTHTSVAIYDSLRFVGLPIIEVHLSNIYKREEFRQKSFISQIADGVICGFGPDVYTLAINAADSILKN